MPPFIRLLATAAADDDDGDGSLVAGGSGGGGGGSSRRLPVCMLFPPRGVCSWYFTLSNTYLVLTFQTFSWPSLSPISV